MSAPYEARYQLLVAYHRMVGELSYAAAIRLRKITIALRADTLDMFDPVATEAGYQFWLDTLETLERRRMRVCDALDRVHARMYPA